MNFHFQISFKFSIQIFKAIAFSSKYFLIISVKKSFAPLKNC